jgi:hypothetical protein
MRARRFGLGPGFVATWLRSFVYLLSLPVERVVADVLVVAARRLAFAREESARRVSLWRWTFAACRLLLLCLDARCAVGRAVSSRLVLVGVSRLWSPLAAVAVGRGRLVRGVSGCGWLCVLRGGVVCVVVRICLLWCWLQGGDG